MKFTGLLLMVFFWVNLNAQVQPCMEYERPKYTTGPHPKTSPIFPGCETFQENNDSLNVCFGRKLGQLIAEKLDREYGGELSDSSIYYKNNLNIHVKTNGNLDLRLLNMQQTPFENKLVEKLNEISKEMVVIPAKYEGNYCAPFTYTLPLVIALDDE